MSAFLYGTPGGPYMEGLRPIPQDYSRAPQLRVRVLALLSLATGILETGLTMNYTGIPVEGDAPGKADLVVEWIAFLLAVVSVGLRIWARKHKEQILRFDDWACVIALIFVAGIAVDHSISVILGGLGQQPEDVSTDSLTVLLQLYPAAEVCWSFSNTLVKLSILYFFRTVFSLQKYERPIQLVGFAVIALGVGNFIQCLAICRPFAYQWDKTIEGGVCGNQNLGILLVAAFSLIVDLMVFILPLPPLLGLKLSAKKKRSIIFIFTLGAFVTFFTIIRIIFTVILIVTENKTYWVAIAEMMFLLEPCLSIVAACVPVWFPLLAKKGNREAFLKTGSSDGYGLADKRKNEHTGTFIRLEDRDKTNLDPAESREVLCSSRTAVKATDDRKEHQEHQEPHAITVTTGWEVESNTIDCQ